MSSSASHDTLTNQILLAVGSSGLARIWKTESGLFHPYGEYQKTIRIGVNGVPDLVGILLGGRWLGVEVKSGRGQLRESQKNFQAMIAKFGGLYIVGRSVEQVLSEIKSSLLLSQERAK